MAHGDAHIYEQWMMAYMDKMGKMGRHGHMDIISNIKIALMEG